MTVHPLVLVVAVVAVVVLVVVMLIVQTAREVGWSLPIEHPVRSEPQVVTVTRTETVQVVQRGVPPGVQAAAVADVLAALGAASPVWEPQPQQRQIERRRT